MQTPILFLIFNRPKLTQQVFDVIKRIKPKFLYVAADGPRDNKDGERNICEETRKVITDGIDWDCELNMLFREQNLGCGRAVSEAITWFFNNVEEGIILEDDCLPNYTFFTFCTELLSYYRYNETIMHISGNNFQLGKIRGDGSYYFSLYPHVWGWATWRRAWEKYDFEMSEYLNFQISHREILYLMPKQMIENTYAKKLDTWDIQWLYSIVRENGLSITPNINLVINLGFGSGTHTTGEMPVFLKKIINSEIGGIQHLKTIDRNIEADNYLNKIYYNPPSNIISKFLSKFQYK